MSTNTNEYVRMVVVHDSRHPWAQTLLLGCVLAGVMGIVGGPNSTSTINRYLPGPWLMAYYCMLIISASVTFVGTHLPKLRDQLNVEQIGLWFLCGPLLVYPMFVVINNGFAIGIGGSISCVLGLGAIWRIIEINRTLKDWKRPNGRTE